jgi:hypothetical protein
MWGVVSRPPGKIIAGGEGTPIAEPAFKTGTELAAHPIPRLPSVQ